MPSGHIKHHKTSYLYALRRQTDTKNYVQNNKWAYKNEKPAQFIRPCIKKDANEAPKMTNKVGGNEVLRSF